MNYPKTLTAFVTMTIGGSSVVALLLTLLMELTNAFNNVKTTES